MGLILDEQKWEQKYNSLIYSLNINIFSVTDTRIFVNVIFTDYKNLFLDSFVFTFWTTEKKKFLLDFYIQHIAIT